ncbi:hypothetical protein AAZX31_01G076100 [Glycine max]
MKLLSNFHMLFTTSRVASTPISLSQVSLKLQKFLLRKSNASSFVCVIWAIFSGRKFHVLWKIHRALCYFLHLFRTKVHPNFYKMIPIEFKQLLLSHKFRT